MSENAPTYPLATIAKLLRASESDVRKLVKLGYIPKPDRGHYELVSAVQGQIRYLEEQVPKAKPGRPSKYKPEFAKQAEHLCKLGATDYELAKFFGVTDRTIYRWQTDHDEFCQALKTGKAELDERVERSLYHKATGYTFESEKIFQFQGEIVRAQVTEHVPPSDTAMIFWLKNRRQEQWRDVKESKVDMTVTEQVKNDAESFKKGIAGLTARTGDQGIPRKPH